MNNKGYVLITGAGSGLGKSLAIQFAKNSYKVVLVGRTKSKLEEVSHLCGKDNSLIIQANIGSTQEVEQCFKISNKWGDHPNIVISCAGEGVFGPVGSFSDDHLKKSFEGSLYGTILISQQAFTEMKTIGGTIVNVMSTAATVGRVNESIYCAAKWGAKGFTESLRLESKGTKVKVIGVYPGGIKTPFWSENCGMNPDTSGFMDPDELAQTLFANIVGKKTLYVADIILNRI